MARNLDTEYKNAIEKLQKDINLVKDERDHYANKCDEYQAALNDVNKKYSDSIELLKKYYDEYAKYKELFHASELIRDHLKEIDPNAS